MVLLGIECGATKSTAIVQFEGKGKDLFLEFGPANYSLMVDTQLTTFLQNIHDTVRLELFKRDDKGQPLTIRRVALGMAGIISNTQINAVRQIVSTVWLQLDTLWVGNDIQVAFSHLTSKTNKDYECQVLVICGTGSVCFGRTATDEQARIGGSGHILGDRGSGYDISHNAIRSTYRQFEHNGTSDLLSAMMKYVDKEEMSEFIQWSLHADKSSLASLTQVVINYWTEYKDKVATVVIEMAIQDLATDCETLIRKLCPPNTEGGDKDILIGFTGSVLTKCSAFSEALASKIRSNMKGLNIDVLHLDTETVRGALNFLSGVESFSQRTETNTTEEENEESLRQKVLPILTALSTTEERNPNSMELDRMPTVQAIQLMLREESGIYSQVDTQIPKISMLIEKITNAFRVGGRLFYVGAGTSGRLGILDASECPPTFKAPHHWVQGIIAGGSAAVFKGIEGAEDSVVGGTEAVKARGVNEKDIVIGIAASGRTPFVWGALYQARKANAFAGLITFNPNMEVNPGFPSLNTLITVNVGPEVLTGSTRLKCGTATKSILNILTTLSMVRYGKCLENLMVDLNASNDKLRDRAARIVLTIVGEEQPTLSKQEVSSLLQQNSYNIKKTVELIREIKK